MRASPKRGEGEEEEAKRTVRRRRAPQSHSRSLALKKAQLLRTVQGYNVHLLPPPRPPPTAQQLSPLFLLPPSVASASPSSPLLLSKGRGEDPEGAFSSA